jgi:hypothetical protein
MTDLRNHDWRAMYLQLLDDWTRVSDFLNIEAESASDIIDAIRNRGDAEVAAKVRVAETQHGLMSGLTGHCWWRGAALGEMCFATADAPAHSFDPHCEHDPRPDCHPFTAHPLKP